MKVFSNKRQKHTISTFSLIKNMNEKSQYLSNVGQRFSLESEYIINISKVKISRLTKPL